MRREQLHQLVTDLVEQTWNGADADLAEAILEDDAFGALCHHLHQAGDVAWVWSRLVESFDDDTLDFLTERADNPAAWLASRARDTYFAAGEVS